MNNISRFRRDELDELRQALRRQSSLQVIRLYSVEQLLLDAELRTRTGFTFTEDAMSRICVRLCPGLSPIVRHLQGRHHVGDDSTVDHRLAAKIFNDVVRARFYRVKGRVLICDSQSMTVETESKSVPKAFSGEEFLDCCLDAARGSHQFQSAVLRGRRLLVAFRNGEKIAIHDPDGERVFYYPGKILVSCGAGHYYLRVANAILRRGGYAAQSLASPYGKEDFQKRNQAAATLACPAIQNFFKEKSPSALQVSEQFDALLRDPLLPGVRDAASHKQQHRKLFKQFRRGLSSAAANRILTRTELPTELRDNPLCVNGIVARSGEAWKYASTRRWYHVFESMLYWQFKLEDGLHSRYSEWVGHVAHHVLCGQRKLKIVDTRKV